MKFYRYLKRHRYGAFDYFVFSGDDELSGNTVILAFSDRGKPYKCILQEGSLPFVTEISESEYLNSIYDYIIEDVIFSHGDKRKLIVDLAKTIIISEGFSCFDQMIDYSKQPSEQPVFESIVKISTEGDDI